MSFDLGSIPITDEAVRYLIAQNDIDWPQLIKIAVESCVDTEAGKIVYSQQGFGGSSLAVWPRLFNSLGWESIPGINL